MSLADDSTAWADSAASAEGIVPASQESIFSYELSCLCISILVELSFSWMVDGSCSLEGHCRGTLLPGTSQVCSLGCSSAPALQVEPQQDPTHHHHQGEQRYQRRAG